MKKTIIAAMSMLVTGTALATTYTGPVQTIRLQTSSITAGATRVSVEVASPVVGCALNTWYAFEFSGDSGAGKAWLAGLIAAQRTGATVLIGGSGTCDPFNIETISYIDLH